MNRAVQILTVSVLGLGLITTAIAQDEQLKQVEEPVDLAPKGYQDSQAGLQVEERRYENRLDSVKVERDSNNVTDYYNLSDPDLERRHGGILESEAMRTWRFGGGR